MLDEAREHLQPDDFRTRALLQFASEEAKHIQLFKRFRREFEGGFGTECQMIGPPEAIANAILAHDHLGIALTTLHIEWMVQRHYVDSIKDDQELDPQFKSLLKHHWMEEVQHAKLDTLMVESLAVGRTEEEVMRGVEEYIEIGGFIDGGLKQQVEFDLDAFERATARLLTADEKDQFRQVQLQANRLTYLGTGFGSLGAYDQTRHALRAGMAKTRIATSIPGASAAGKVFADGPRICRQFSECWSLIFCCRSSRMSREQE